LNFWSNFIYFFIRRHLLLTMFPLKSSLNPLPSTSEFLSLRIKYSTFPVSLRFLFSISLNFFLSGLMKILLNYLNAFSFFVRIFFSNFLVFLILFRILIDVFLLLFDRGWCLLNKSFWLDFLSFFIEVRSLIISF